MRAVFVCFFRKIDENYASPIYQSLRENAGDATRLNSLINSLTLFHNKIHDFHVCITLLRVKLEIKSVPDLQAKTLIIYAAYLHNYMILSVTLIEEFPRRRRQVIIKKYIRQGIIQSDRRSPWRIKQSQFYKARSSLLGDRGDRNLKRQTTTNTNTKTKTKKTKKKQQQQKRLCCRLKNTFTHFLHTIKIQWNFFQEFPLYFFLFLFCFCFFCIFLSNEDHIKC